MKDNTDQIWAMLCVLRLIWAKGDGVLSHTYVASLPYQNEALLKSSEQVSDRALENRRSTRPCKWHMILSCILKFDNVYWTMDLCEMTCLYSLDFSLHSSVHQLYRCLARKRFGGTIEQCILTRIWLKNIGFRAFWRNGSYTTCPEINTNAIGKEQYIYKGCHEEEQAMIMMDDEGRKVAISAMTSSRA